MARPISEIIDEQKDKEVTLTGEQLYQIFKDGFYSGIGVGGYDPNPMYWCNSDFIRSTIFQKLKEVE